MDTERIKIARQVLEDEWSDQGACGSCGWHASLYEHGVEDYQLEEALEGDGILELICVSKDDEYSSSHRGIRIDVRRANP